MYTPSKECMDLIRKYEGCKLTAYLCSAGKWTVGWGTTYHPEKKRPVQEGDTVTQKQANEWLQRFVDKLAMEVVGLTKGVGTQGQLDALLSFTYNFGSTKLATSSLLKFHRAGNINLASEEFKKWNKVMKNGVLVPEAGLIARREAERKMYVSI